VDQHQPHPAKDLGTDEASRNNTGADRIWIVERSATGSRDTNSQWEFFLNFAWDTTRWNERKQSTNTTPGMVGRARNFGAPFWPADAARGSISRY
jgi:hypothetical protein